MKEIKDSKDVLAFELIRDKYENNYNELNDVLYHYMLTYLRDDMMENGLFIDELENLIGIRKHEKIIQYILKN